MINIYQIGSRGRNNQDIVRMKVGGHYIASNTSFAYTHFFEDIKISLDLLSTHHFFPDLCQTFQGRKYS